jgi:oxazoline/thiazoline dehydrogenase
VSVEQTLELSLRPDVPLIELPEGILVFRSAESENLAFQRVSPAMRAVFDKLREGGCTEQQLSLLVMEQDGPTALMSFYQHMHKLASHALFCHTLPANERPLATITPIARHYRFQPNLVEADQPYTLSRFAYLHNHNGQMVLECPLGFTRITLHDGRATALLTALAQPQTAQQLAGDLDEETTRMFLNFLANGNALTTPGEDGKTAEESSPTLGQWDFHDLLFHSRSRQGRHNNPYGGSFRSRGKFDPLPLVKPPMSGEVITLYKPDMEQLKQNDQPFAAVLEQRRSIRNYDDDKPVTAEQLGEFLYRSARFTHVLPIPAGELPLGLKIIPGGGAIHELEIYPVIDRVEGIAAGLYHYNALDHTLEKVTDRNQWVETLLYIAWITADKRSKPQVYLGITARFQRFQWKYESMVYAAVLKHVGVLYQTMYLVATAMGLAPCALGGGNSDLFKSASGLDYYAESLVGEFILGSKGVPEHVAGGK